MIEIPNSIGIVGGGQLGRMETMAAKQLGFEVWVVDPVPNCPAEQVGAHQIQAQLNDGEAIEELARRANVLTWEIEHFPAGVLTALTDRGVDVQPSPRTLEIVQDKLWQKRFLSQHGIPVAPFMPFEEAARLEGNQFVVKAQRGGFDGRSNLTVTDLSDPAIADKLSGQVYVEQKVDLQKELSLVAARSRSGYIAAYPLVEMVHEDTIFNMMPSSICQTVTSPAQIDPAIGYQATEIAHETLKLLDGAGVFGIELFVDTNDRVMVNEIAPRVHNTGHHTLDSCETSQFEQHVRAVTGLPLGPVVQRAPVAVMVNILGRRGEPLNRAGLHRAMELGAKVHFYGKSSRFERKIGHLTVLGETVEDTMQRARLARLALAA